MVSPSDTTFEAAEMVRSLSPCGTPTGTGGFTGLLGEGGLEYVA